MTFPTSLPASRVPDPMAAPPLRSGLLGTGWIAEKFAGALARNTQQRVTAVGSRSVASAKGRGRDADEIRRQIGVTYLEESAPGVPA